MADFLTALRISGSGLSAQRSRVDIASSNLANAESAATPGGKAYQARGACPEAPWLPRGLGSLDIVLVQTRSDGIDADAWGERWEAVLGCAGAHVRRHRYSPAITIAELLGPDEPAPLVARAP